MVSILTRLALGRFIHLSAFVAIAFWGATAGAAEPPKFAGISGDFSPIDPPEQIAAPKFQDKMGQPVGLDDFKGKVVVLNFWATWCPPCVAEMPALDQLQSDLGGKDFAVVAVSTDRQGIKKSAPFYRRAGIKNLSLYNDTRGSLQEAFQARSLPFTVVIDREGRLVGRIEGAAQWDSTAAKALIAHYLKGNAS
ncbi:TlpA disulfide reductase family protein [Dongia sp.]|uniref:TlpA disulfide reductase family protein n=1 Tax=Dongia sp. TaxID=1977262 RepID=UPI003751DD98